MTVSIEDRLAIGDLFARYMWALDTGDVEGLVTCFTKDGALESPVVGRYAGREGIRSFAERFAQLPASGTQLRHVISNLQIEAEGERGFARCYLLVYVTRNGQSRLLGPGRYECRVRKEDGAWRFENRLVVMDHDYVIEGL